MFTATKDAANQTANKAEAAIHDAKATAYQAKRDLRDVTKEAKHDLSDIAHNAGRQVRQMVDTAGERLTDVNDRIVGEVRANPVRSSVIALGLGFIIGAIVRR